MEKRIKNFNDFENNINEGLVSWASKKFKQGELDVLIYNIYNIIRNNFKISNLKGELIKEYRSYFYIYEINHDTLKVSKSQIILNNDNITEHVNKHYITDIFNYFDNKYRNFEKELKDEKYKQDVQNIKNKYKDKYLTEYEEDEEV